MRPAPAIPVALLSLTLSLALAGITPGLARAEGAGEAPAAPEIALPAIAVTTVRPVLLRERVIVTGLIFPVEEVQVQPLIEGQPIEALFADIGDMVETGTVLARLSRTTLDLQRSQSLATLAAARATIAQGEAQLIEATAAAGEARRVADRTGRLRGQGTATDAAFDAANAGAVAADARVAVARQSLEAANAQLALAEAQLANVDLMLTRTEVRAPYGGRITTRNAVIGAIASAQGAPMFTLEKDAALELRAEIAETDIARLAPGQKVSLKLAGSDTPVAGRLRLIEPAIDSMTRLGRARIELNPDPGLLAGMFAEAEILIREAEMPALPLGAIAGNTVLRVSPGKDGAATVSVVSVTTGIRDQGYVGILDGLAEGDQVVARAGSFLREGDLILPLPADASAGE